MKRYWYLFLLVLVGGLCFAQGQQDVGQKTTLMRVGDIENVANLGAVALDTFAEQIAAATEGALEVRPFHASQLGSANKQLELVKSGTLEAFRGSISWLAQFDTGFSLTDFPFVCDSPQQAKAIAESEAFRRLNDRLSQEHGIRFVTSGWIRLPRQILIDRPVESLEELQQIKIRVPECYSYIESFKALGMIPTPVAFSETYLALRQGIVDGAENHVESLYTMRWYESCKHLVITDHSYDITGFIVNDRWWASLSEEYRSLIIDTFEQIDSWYAAENASLEQHYIELMKEAGVTVHRIDTTGLRAAVYPGTMLQAEEDGQWEPGLWAEIEELLQQED